jgi:hypothetical protein
MIRCLAPREVYINEYTSVVAKTPFHEGSGPGCRHELGVQCDLRSQRVAENLKDIETDIGFFTASPPMTL